MDPRRPPKHGIEDWIGIYNNKGSGREMQTKIST
jgi:hypothetical protein